MARSTTGPIVMFGTKRPSITSTWIQSAPAASTARTSSPNRVKSADSTEGATSTGCMVATSIIHKTRRLGLSDLSRFSQSTLSLIVFCLRILSLAGRCPIDEPDELTHWPDAGGWNYAGARANRAEDGRLLPSCHQKGHPPAALDRRIGHGNPNLGPAMRHRGNPALPLSQP